MRLGMALGLAIGLAATTGYAAERLPAGASAADRPSKLIEQWWRTLEDCRGTAPSKVCDQNTAYEVQLNRMGWCFGRENQAFLDRSWQRCGPGSLKVWGHLRPSERARVSRLLKQGRT